MTKRENFDAEGRHMQRASRVHSDRRTRRLRERGQAERALIDAQLESALDDWEEQLETLGLDRGDLDRGDIVARRTYGRTG